jgi:hypothetical protein
MTHGVNVKNFFASREIGGVADIQQDKIKLYKKSTSFFLVLLSKVIKILFLSFRRSFRCFRCFLRGLHSST